jgi:diguanylate cyclase (GGDEF)-like protein/PAS domain S-box-containing protein
MPKKKRVSSMRETSSRVKSGSGKGAPKRQDSLHQISQILSAATNGIVALDTDGIITLANPAAADLLNRDVGAMRGVSVQSAFVYGSGHEDAGIPLPLIAQFESGPHSMDQEVHMARSGGESFEAVYSVAPIHENDDVSGYVITFHDVTERRHSESELRLAAAVFDHSPEGLVVADAKQRVIRVNPAYARLAAVEAQHVVGQELSGVLLSGAGVSGDALERLQSQDKTQWEQWCKNKHGKRYAARISVAVVKDEAGIVQQYVAMVSDITQRKLDEEKITYQANYDQLTNLPNRTLFMDRLTRRALEGKRSKTSVGLLFVDLDGFKVINDTLGHDAGDQLLVEVSRRLEKCVREADTVARLGGDEFTVIMPLIDNFEAAAVVAGRVITSLGEPFDLQGREGRISASIGVSILPAQASTASELLHNADVAMYQAKRSGKSKYEIYRPELEDTVEVVARDL